VRVTTRQLCAGSPLPSTCTAADGTSIVRVAWYDVSTDDVQSVVERLEPNGAWTVRQTINGAVTNQSIVTDRGLSPDTRYCYRVTVKGSTGLTKTSTSSACVVTQKAGDVPVTRAQLRVVVASVSGGGTNGAVSVALTEPPGGNLPTGNFTGINTARAEFKAGSDVLYELNIKGVESFRDITRISVASGSTDAFCVEHVQLVLNNSENNDTTPNSGIVVYDKYFGGTARTCRWVGSTYGPLLVGHAELRATPAFNGFTGGLPLVAIGKRELEARLEPIIGTLFWGRRDVTWDTDQSYAVTVTHSASSGKNDSVHVHLDLEGIAEGPNPEVDLDFDVTVKFTPTDSPTVWDVAFDAHDITATADFAWWTELLSGLLDPICVPVVGLAQRDAFLDCISHLEDHIEDMIEASFEAPTEKTPITLPNDCIQPSVVVRPTTHSIHFACDKFATPQPTLRGNLIQPPTLTFRR
jgi:hypothetical protein